MKILSLTYVVSTAILLTTDLAVADRQGQPLSSHEAASPRRFVTEIVVAQSTSSGQRSIIIVSGRNSQPGSLNSFDKSGSRFSNPASKVMLNPQPLPPKTR